MIDAVELPLCNWPEAVALFRIGERKPLAMLVRACVVNPASAAHYLEGVDAEIADAVAAAIEGRLRPDRRGRRAGAISDGRKRSAVDALKYLRQVRDAMKATRPLPRGLTLQKVEVKYTDAVERLAAEYGVDSATLEGWSRPSRTK